MPSVPADFLDKWLAYAQAMSSIQPSAIAIGIGSLFLIVLLRRSAPRLPGFLIAIILASILVAAFNIPVDTVGSRFPDMPAGLPMPSWPDISIALIKEMLPSAFTIAFLAGIEALLSAVVADGMAGTRHRSNQELVGQGVANVASALFGGLPATGAIARTATNIKAGAKTPIAGILHAVFLLLFIVFATDLMAYVPMAALAAILFVVAWGMSEYERFIALLSMPNGDRAVLLLTFGLTVFVDLTVAIAVGVTVASLLFMARMSETVRIDSGQSGAGDSDLPDDAAGQRDDLPKGVEVFRITGPFFFGVAGELLDALRRVGQSPKIIILRMRLVPMLDASGVSGVESFIMQARQSGASVIISGAQVQAKAMLARGGLDAQHPGLYFCEDYDSALQRARALLDEAGV
jgi:sulfate permease, SulP family